MNEKRRSQRINYLGTGWLHHRGTPYFCRLENISAHGAMVGVREVPADAIQCGEKCSLKLFQDDEGERYADFTVRIVRFESSVIGLEFGDIENGRKDILENIITRERHLFEGADKIITLAREVAGQNGIELADVHFDRGELLAEREIHTLRFFTGKRSAKVHLHRRDIERFYVREGSAPPVQGEIFKALDRLRG